MRPDLIVVGEVRGAEVFELTLADKAGAEAGSLIVDVCRMYAYVSCRRVLRRTGLTRNFWKVPS